MKINNYIIISLFFISLLFLSSCAPAVVVSAQWTTKASCESYVNQQFCPNGYKCYPCEKPVGSQYYSTNCYPSGSTGYNNFSGTNICSSSVCVYGDKRCVNNNVVERCNYVSSSVTGWETYQTCSSGSTCTGGTTCSTVGTYSCTQTTGGTGIDWYHGGTMTISNCLYSTPATKSYSDSCLNDTYAIKYTCGSVTQAQCDKPASSQIHINGYYCKDGGLTTINPNQPNTCSELGKNCGSWPNGIGGTLNCGTCNTGNTCNTGVCTPVSTPKTCSDLGYTCGTWDNQAGGTINCGSCAQGTTCGATGVCVAATQCTGNNECNDNNACTSDICSNSYCSNTAIIPTPEGCGIQCSAYQSMNNGVCSFDFSKLFTGEGIKQFYEDTTVMFFIIIGGIILIVLLIILMLKRRNNVPGLY